MRGFRRLVFILVTAGLVAAVPLSAVASEGILGADVRQSKVAFGQSLAQAVRDGLDRSQADQLMWRFTQVSAMKPSSWWQSPLVEHAQLDKLSQLHADLRVQYQRQTADARDAMQRQLHRWSQMIAEAKNAGVTLEGLEAATPGFRQELHSTATPNDLLSMAEVLSEEYGLLSDRTAAFRSARAQVDSAAENVRALLASAAQYPELSLGGFQAQLGNATAGVPSVHDAGDFTPIVAQIQQTAAGVQGLLNARMAAYNQLADTRSTLQTAQGIGALIGNAPSQINAAAAQLPTASDQPTFESLTSQLYQTKQVLATSIYMKEMSPLAYNAGVGKLIVISISRQALTAYQDGAAVMTTLITTGRPALPTPTGVYHIFARYSPYLFVSPWPYGSPYWYPSSWTSFAMEFAGGGYFIHDAPWRSWYGPGSNTYNGTHGCVNVPYSQMSFLFGWTPMGTTVVVQW